MEINTYAPAEQIVKWTSLNDFVTELTSSLSVICQAKGLQLSLSAEENQDKKIDAAQVRKLQAWIPKIIRTLPDNSPLKIDNLEHDGQTYFLLSLPAIDVLKDPRDQRNMLLSYLLSAMAQQLPYIVRRQNQGSFSAFTLKFKLSTK
jgi:hypothetical protein